MSGDDVQKPARRELHFPVRLQRAQREQVKGEQTKGESDSVTQVIQHTSWIAERTAVVVCDLWDTHWCQSASSQIRRLAPAIEHFLSGARKQGMLIVHSPSGTLDYYSEHPARQRALSALGSPVSGQAKHVWIERNPQCEPQLPIDDSDGGCPCSPVCESKKVFTRQSDVISIDAADVISTDEHEIRAVFDRQSIETVMILGVHLNMCILGRSFGIRRWVELGREILLVRDLTDVIYNPGCYPFVTPDQALGLVITHIETYLCPSVSSWDVLAATSDK